MKTQTIQWKNEFSVGLHEVDLQHKRFLNIVNQLGQYITDGSFKSKGFEIFFALIHFADNYLLKEKMLVNTVPDVDYSYFRQKHKAFIAKITDFQQSYQTEDAFNVYLKLYAYLKETFPEFLSCYTPSLVNILKRNELN